MGRAIMTLSFLVFLGGICAQHATAFEDAAAKPRAKGRCPITGGERVAPHAGRFRPGAGSVVIVPREYGEQPPATVIILERNAGEQGDSRQGVTSQGQSSPLIKPRASEALPVEEKAPSSSGPRIVTVPAVDDKKGASAQDRMKSDTEEGYLVVYGAEGTKIIHQPAQPRVKDSSPSGIVVYGAD